jgi:demethylmenaquinone methyltransferase/2-methoxy-6-polyprenyl-1,4-benzoquinol methylase
LPYADASFQGVTSAFAMRNVKPMLPEVLAEAFRVTAPGGRLAILEFSRPRLAPVRWGHGLYTRVLMPRVGRLLTGTSEPFEYLYRSIQEWYAPEQFTGLLRSAGFDDVAVRMMGFGTVALHTARKPGAGDARLAA